MGEFMAAGALVRVLLSFSFVVALMLLLSWVARRLKLPEKLTRAKSTKVGGLAVDDVVYLDARHRLVSIKRGTMRHVILLSNHPQTSPLLIESYHEMAEEKPSESDKNENVE